MQHTFTDGSDTSDGSDESFYPPSSDDLEGVLVAFCAMEYRRLRRIRNGRIVKDGLGRHLNSAMKGIIVVLLLAEVFDITTQRFGIQQVWIIPAGLTLALVIPAAVQTLYYPEHTFTLWVSTELYAFCLWFAWWFDARDESNKDTLHCWRLPQSNWFAAEQICVDVNQIMASYVFLAILLATIVLFLPHRVIMPCAIYFNFLQGRWLVNWRAVRRLPKLPGDRDDSWHYTYKPSGLFGWNREEFMYIGEVDSDGRPHGGGFWYDSSFHGECLRGEWVHGAPAGMWFSREYGTGAHFLQCAVGYATARSDCKKDTLHKSALFPHKDQELRFGLGQVEASFAGGFFPFLPAVNYHSQMSSGEDLVEQLLHVYQKRQAHEEPSNLRLEVLPEATFHDMYVGEWSQVPIHFCEGECLGYVPEQTISHAKSLRPSAEALVFIHGFNCDLATALGRVAQTFSLGNMPPHIVPFVFSYAGGAELTYFQARARFADYGADLRSFLEILARHFTEVHILTHSCGAEFFFTNWPEIADCFTLRRSSVSSRVTGRNGRNAKQQRWVARHSRRMDDEGMLHLATLTMLNPDVLFGMAERLLPDILRRAEHFTAYSDSNDGALFWSGVVRCLLSAVTGNGCKKQPLLGKSVQPLFWDGYELKRGHERGMKRRHSLDSRITGGPRVMSGPVSHLSSLVNKPQIPGDGSVDIIDCSNIDQNVHALRHNYFMLNTQMVEDVCDLIGHRQKAPNRSRLCQHSDGNVFSFLSPPSFLKS